MEQAAALLSAALSSCPSCRLFEFEFEFVFGINKND